MEFETHRDRFRRGEWRGTVFRDLVLADIRRSVSPTVMDIGCGRGFDDSRDLQISLAESAGKYIGVEPDTGVALSDIFTETHRCPLEDAPLAPDSVDVAFCVMVLEHLEHPQAFWDKVGAVLRPGGVFWGFSMDARFYFPRVSRLLATVKLKDLYLNFLHGKRSEERYENYPVFYRSNTPRDLRRLGGRFESVTCLPTSLRSEGSSE